MTEKKARSNQADDLRRRAEKLAREKAALTPEGPEPLSPDAARSLLHDLRVHQIELEMQNEELRRAQVELEASRARYFDLYDLAPVGYFTLSEQGLILEANLAAAALFGVARAALAKQPFSRFVVREDQDIYYQHRKQLSETGAPQVCELRLAKQDGTLFWAQLEATVAHDADGAPLSRAVMSDISERKRVDEEKARIEGQRQQLQKAESLRRMAAAIAHRFNNLLQIVTANLELATRELPQDATGPAKKLTAAMLASGKAAEIIGQTLTYLGHAFAQRAPLDLSDVCRRSLPMLEAALPKDVVLSTDLPLPGPTVSANADQVQQVLTSLVTNAWEAIGDGGGVVHVAVKTVSPADVPAAHRFPVDWRPRDSAHACLEVTDSGCGIGQDDVATLFDPFFSSKLLGRGLGLSVVLGIVRTHGGGVTVESAAGRGSTFRVFMPASPEQVCRWEDEATDALEMKGVGTVLLIEAEQMVRGLAAAMLTHLGFAVLEARDGTEALSLFRQHRDEIRCALCDSTLPGMSARDTMAALHTLSSDLPVILTGSYAEAEATVGGHSERSHAFLSKPYQLKRLSDALARALASKRK
jgi:two-component system cell cycle sensor histidine kinase/response regulator CckA